MCNNEPSLDYTFLYTNAVITYDCENFVMEKEAHKAKS